MCRGCCCGTERKHPDVDHDAIAAAIEDSPGRPISVVRVDCLWACEHSNVVVINPATEARQRGARPAWITQVNTLQRAEAVASWVRAGGPGHAPAPSELGPILTGADIHKRTTGW